MNYNMMSEKVKSYLTENNQDYSNGAIDLILLENTRVKKAVTRDFISKLPNYDEQLERAYIEVETIATDFNGFYHFKPLVNLRQQLSNIDVLKYPDLNGNDHKTMISLHGMYLSDAIYYFFTSVTIEGVHSGLSFYRYERFLNKELPLELKWSRYVARIFDAYMKQLTEWEAPSDLIKDLRKLYDVAINEISAKMKGETVKVYFSSSPYDFFRMSEGNSWHSCHSIYDGDYKGGTTSYILDSLSIIMYVESNGNSLQHRRVCFIYDNTIGFSRAYGNIGGDEALINSVVSELTKYFGTMDKADQEVYYTSHSDSLQYPDYKYNPVDTFLFKDTIVETIAEPIVGATAICIECGRQHYQNESINCCTGSSRECEVCGHRHDEEDMYWVEGYGMVCDDCVIICHHCGEAMTENDATATNNGMVCESCLTRHDYYQCDECGEYVQIDDTISTEDDETGEVNLFCSGHCRNMYFNI